MIDKIPQNVLSSLVRLNEAGYEAYIVGGAVRDILMKRTPFDFDNIGAGAADFRTTGI